MGCGVYLEGQGIVIMEKKMETTIIFRVRF